MAHIYEYDSISIIILQTKYQLSFHFPQMINKYKTIKLLHINTFNLHTYTKMFPFCSDTLIIINTILYWTLNDY